MVKFNSSFFGEEDDTTFLSFNTAPTSKAVLTNDAGFYYSIYGPPHCFFEVLIVSILFIR